MKRSLENVKEQLQLLKPTLRKRFNVETIDIFGSYARCEQTEKSDLDLLVTFSEPIGVYGFIEVEKFLKKKLGMKVDLVQKGAILPILKDQILSETVQI